MWVIYITCRGAAQDLSRDRLEPRLAAARQAATSRGRPAPPPRSARREGSVCTRVSPPALRSLELSPLALGSPPVPAGVPVVRAHKALPSAPGFGYNPHSR